MASEQYEASNEELQAINEELTTVNQELKNSVEQLSRANGDLQNLMASTEIGTIFLDRQMCIRRFTPRVQELFNLIPTDTGRPLSDITHKLNYSALTADAERVLHDLRPSEREVGSMGLWFLVRILPYRTAEDRIDGVVLTFVDITARKHAENMRVCLEQEVAVLAERNRMAGELHDTFAQGFTAIKLQMDAAELGLEESPNHTRERIVRCREIALQSVTEARRSIQALQSPLMEQGLVPQPSCGADFEWHRSKVRRWWNALFPAAEGRERTLPYRSRGAYQRTATRSRKACHDRNHL